MAEQYDDKSINCYVLENLTRLKKIDRVLINFVRIRLSGCVSYLWFFDAHSKFC